MASTRRQRLTACGVAVATFVVLSVLSGDSVGSVGLSVIVGALATAMVVAVLEFHDGPLRRRTGVVGALVLSSVLVAIALWLHVVG